MKQMAASLIGHHNYYALTQWEAVFFSPEKGGDLFLEGRIPIIKKNSLEIL